MPFTIAELLTQSGCKGDVVLLGNADIEIDDMVNDAAAAGRGKILVALDYHDRVSLDQVHDAISRGCDAVLTRRPLPLAGAATQLVADNFGSVVGRMASFIHGHPSRTLRVLAVTGTNGKTTTNRFFQQIMQQSGFRIGLVGSNVYELGDEILESWKTTPYPPDMHRLLQCMVAAGLDGVGLEASSGGLMMDRLLATETDVAVFTNLTTDHMIHHHTMEAYFDAKARLFVDPEQADLPGWAVINIDDEWGRKLCAMKSLQSEVITYGLDAAADVRAEAITPAVQNDPQAGIKFRLVSPWGSFDATLPLFGRFNLYNALAAWSAAACLGANAVEAAAALSTLQLPAGRQQEIPTDRGFRVFIDYAHSPDSLTQVTAALRQITPSRLIVLFGCSGMRGCIPADIGRAAASHADLCIVTTQDPGDLDPAVLAAGVVEGFPSGVEYQVVADRGEAIALAINGARPGDVILLAGKGHERAQMIDGQRIAHDEIGIATTCLLDDGSRLDGVTKFVSSEI